MSAQIIAFPLPRDRNPIAQNLQQAFPIRSAPDDMMDLWQACRDALDNLHDKDKLESVSILLEGSA